MAHQVHIGRLDITSPASLDFSGGGGSRDLRIYVKIAETKSQQINRFSKENEHPLKTDIEELAKD